LVPRLPLIEAEAARPEVAWCVANQPIVNVSNLRNPYWWVFDPAGAPWAGDRPGRWQRPRAVWTPCGGVPGAPRSY
jgi:hypothetical protein